MKITSSNGPAPTRGSRRKIAIALAAVAAAALLFAGQATAKPGKERERHGRPERPSVETTTTIAAVTTTEKSNTTLMTRPTTVVPTTTTTTSTTTGGGPECGPRWKVEGPGCVPCDPASTSTTQAGGTCAPSTTTVTTTITTTAVPTTTITTTAVPTTATTTEVPVELAVPNPWEAPNHGCTEGSYWNGNGCVSDGRVWR